LLKKVTIAFLNSSELRVVSGRKDETEGVREILESGPKCLVVTKGAKGAFMYCDNYVFYTPAKVYSEIKDPTGAGDSFVGAFMGFLSNIMEPTIEDYISAFVVGSAMSSFCIENYGTLGLQHLSNSRIADRIGYIKKGVKEVTQH
jgi:sugar/nucleoside kinase (ribokinase family)